MDSVSSAARDRGAARSAKQTCGPAGCRAATALRSSAGSDPRGRKWQHLTTRGREARRPVGRLAIRVAGGPSLGYEELKGRGVEFVEQPEEHFFYGIDSSFRDPSGNHIRLTRYGRWQRSEQRRRMLSAIPPYRTSSPRPRAAGRRVLQHHAGALSATAGASDSALLASAQQALAHMLVEGGQEPGDDLRRDRDRPPPRGVQVTFRAPAERLQARGLLGYAVEQYGER